MANKKKNSEAAPTPEQQARAASSSRKKQRKTYVSKTVKIVLVVIGVLAMLLSVSAMACSGLMSQAEDTSGYKLTGGCCCHYQRHQPYRGHRDQADHEHAHVLRLHQG